MTKAQDLADKIDLHLRVNSPGFHLSDDDMRLIAASLRGGELPQSPSDQAVADALSLLSDLFSETAHETWTKGEVVEVIEDFAKLRCPDTRPDREGK